MVQKLSFGTQTFGSDSSGIWFKGTFKNNNSFSTKYTQSLTTLYDKWGNVMNVSKDWTVPMNISAGGSSQYYVHFGDNYTQWNRALVLLQATQGT